LEPGREASDELASLAIKRVGTKLDEVSTGRGTKRRSFIETPARCPSDRTWTNTTAFTYRDGVTQVERNPFPVCPSHPLTGLGGGLR
jgi:hypothetical protein